MRVGAPLPRGLWMRVKVDCTDGVLDVAIDDLQRNLDMVSQMLEQRGVKAAAE